MKSVVFLVLLATVFVGGRVFADSQEMSLVKPCVAPIVVNGQQIGSVKLPAGATVTLVSVQSDGFLVSRGGGTPFKLSKDYLALGSGLNAGGESTRGVSVLAAQETLLEQGTSLVIQTRDKATAAMKSLLSTLANQIFPDTSPETNAPAAPTGTLQTLTSMVMSKISPVVPEEQKAKITAQRDAAIARVKEIVNQPVRHQLRTSSMRVSEYSPGWFHPGAITPDFKTVDVRATQDLNYGKNEYISSDLNPGMVFNGRDVEFNSMTKYFYTDRTLPKKRLSESEMLEINQLYRVIAQGDQQLSQE